MNQRHVRDILGGARGGLGATILRAGLVVPALPYSLVMRVRRWAYRMGLLPSRRAGLPVICVGNLTTGGTGKTPMAAWVVRQLREMGRTPAVLTRGYKAVGGKSDEAELLKAISAAPVIVNGDRARGARDAAMVRTLGADGRESPVDVLVMDDGFQHRRLHRDLDIVLVDATNPWGFGWCLPRGLLREPLSALGDAHAIVITHSDAVSDDALQAIRHEVARRAPRASVHLGVHKPTELFGPDGKAAPLGYLQGRKVAAFCGIGNPDRFFAMLRALGADLVSTHPLDDHVAYTKGVVDALRAAADKAGAEMLVTTQKDGVKLPGADLGRPIHQLAVEIEIAEGREELVRRLGEAIGATGLTRKT
jgi:tetraacyldisaccharide 4'-kinase